MRIQPLAEFSTHLSEPCSAVKLVKFSPIASLIVLNRQSTSSDVLSSLLPLSPVCGHLQSLPAAFVVTATEGSFASLDMSLIGWISLQWHIRAYKLHVLPIEATEVILLNLCAMASTHPE